MTDFLARSNAKLRLNNFRSLGDWRKTRVSFNREPSINHGLQNDSPIMYGFSRFPVRNFRYVDEVNSLRINHRGWFSDAECSETYRGFIYNLPHGRFGAGQYRSGNGEHVYYLKVFDDEGDAVSYAEGEAENDAEEAKAYDEKWQEKSALEFDIESKRKEIARLLPIRNHKELGPEARSDIEDYIGELREMRERLATEFEEIK